MSQWAKAQQLSTETLNQILAIYGDHFPIEIRHLLAPWIEDKFTFEFDPMPDNPQHVQYVTAVIKSLFTEIELKCKSLITEELFLTRVKLHEAAKLISSRYSSNPMVLFIQIRNCLASEMRLIQSAEVEPLGRNDLINANILGARILPEIELLKRRTQESEVCLQKIEQEYESFSAHCNNCNQINTQLQLLLALPVSLQNKETEQILNRRKEMVEIVINQKIFALMQLREAFASNLKDTISLIKNLQERIIEEIMKWKRAQQLACNGASFNNNLNTIQELCENFAESIWANREQIKKAENLKQHFALHPLVPDELLNFFNQITQMLSALISYTFIIEKQPPQVIKVNARFTSIVRLLVGKKLNFHLTPTPVTVSIISETQLNTLFEKKLGGNYKQTCGEIKNNTGLMIYLSNIKQYAASLRTMQLKKIRRSDKQGTVSVTEEKFCLLFQTEFSIDELKVRAWTISLPIVVVVHSMQEPASWATVTWDNAFARQGRISFFVPEWVPWSTLAENLSFKFEAATGKPLTESNLRFLAEKAFAGNFQNSNQILSWTQCCKNFLPYCKFTFWEWFYAVMKLTKDHLKGLWVDGFLLGFIQKSAVEEILKKCPNGTFLLRFSDSILGAISIAWVGQNGKVFILQPFTSKDFAMKSLSDRITELKNLTYLYPNITKETAFGKYYTPLNEIQLTANGYVKPTLMTHIPGLRSLDTGSCSNTHNTTSGSTSS